MFLYKYGLEFQGLKGYDTNSNAYRNRSRIPPL